MQYTSITQKRYSVNSNSTTKFRIETNIIDAGELPRVDIFVYTIVDVNDPTTDVFSNIASLSELQELKDERDKAISAVESSYLSPYLEMEYTDLETAIAAVSTLNSRINDLVLSWISYSTDFNTNGDLLYNLPTATDSELDARKNTYLEAKEETAEAVANVATLETTLAENELALSNSQEILAIYKTQKEFCDEVINTQYPTYISLVLTGNGESTAAFNYRTGTDSLEDNMSSFCASISAAIATWTNTVATNQSTLNTTIGEKIAAEIELDKLEQKETEALASIIEICPDFDPSTL